MDPMHYNVGLGNYLEKQHNQENQLDEDIEMKPENGYFVDYGHWNLYHPLEPTENGLNYDLMTCQSQNLWSGHVYYPNDYIDNGMTAVLKQEDPSDYGVENEQYVDNWKGSADAQQIFVTSTDSASPSSNYSLPIEQVADVAMCNAPQNSVDQQISITLRSEQWQVFQAKGQIEQLANNEGRRMFPTLEFEVAGLEPDGLYVVGIQMRRVTGQLGFNESLRKWAPRHKPVKKIPPESSNELFTTPTRGSAMWNGINLEKVKMYTIGERTIDKEVKPEMIQVYSRHMYIPQVRILKQMPDGTLNEVAKDVFEEASFVVVSKLKDQLINALRCQKNKHSRFKLAPRTIG